MTSRIIRREAPAKINVFLRVLGARDDGYHDLESLVVPTSLADVGTGRDADAPRGEVTGRRPPSCGRVLGRTARRSSGAGRY